MAGGLVALLDDIAALTKAAAASLDDVAAAAAKASVKATGVVVDDTAVTPRYVDGFSPDRELPVVKKIAIGSIKNKLLIILPVALLLSQFFPQALPYLLIAGGLFLSYEGAEKVWEAVSGQHDEDDQAGQERDADAENKMVNSAIRTDLILSAEIMVIALSSVSHEPFLTRLMVLIVVAFVITALVYGVVAIIVKMDDVGLALAGRQSKVSQKVGRGLVAAMPKLMATLSVVGIVAMLWVGGHILISNIGEAGWHWPADQLHLIEHSAHDLVSSIGGVLSWLAGTTVSALVGFSIGGILVTLFHVLPHQRHAAH